MPNPTVYLKCTKNVEIMCDDVYMKDIASLRCQDSVVGAKLKSLKVYHFGAETERRCVISVTKLIEMMENSCPDISVEVIGETDVVIERVSANKNKGFKQWLKITLVCLVSFFGTAFTIMAFHNDVGIRDVFTEIYRMVMNKEPGLLNVLEVSYSVGLALGIVLFFNHVGGRRLTKDPTPIEVEMRNYERDVNDALIDTAGREGKEIDV